MSEAGDPRPSARSRTSEGRTASRSSSSPPSEKGERRKRRVRKRREPEDTSSGVRRVASWVLVALGALLAGLPSYMFIV